MSQLSRIVFSIVKMAKANVWIVKIVVNCRQLSSIVKIVKIVKIITIVKMVRIVKIVKNC